MTGGSGNYLEKHDNIVMEHNSHNVDFFWVISFKRVEKWEKY